jgi:16S rRNA C967 or C1407 C5-methylase (RsmB/RsmF family)
MSIKETFRKYLEEAIGGEKALVAFSAFDEPAKVSVRLNPFKKGHDFEGSPVPWNEYGRLLPERPKFTLDPCLHGGAYYVQDSSSMFVGHVFRKVLQQEEMTGRPIVRVLDLCAAPGGKTTDLAASLRQAFGDRFILVSNEVMKQRAAVLAENVALWGDPNVVVTSDDPRAFAALPGFFDIVVTDVPCSGEGMFRKDEEAQIQWSEDNVALCQARQKRIVADIWPALRQGGIMIYSTCTYNSAENGDNLAWIASELGAQVLYSEQCFPGEKYGEGFFFGVLRKEGSEQHAVVKDPLRGASVKPYKDKIEFVSDEFVCYRKGDLVKAYPSEVAGDMIYAESHLRTLSGGCAVASVMEGAKGRTLVPETDIALGKALKRGVFPEVELSLEDALRYLRKDALVLSDKPKGYLLMTYKGVPLGFVKNIGNRSNNLWPQGWRIRNV